MSEAAEAPTLDHVELTADIVSAYVSNNHIQPSEIANLVTTVHSALTGLGMPAADAAPQVEKPSPAQIRKSVSHEALISFEDGKSYKTLKRHLSKRGLTPEEYRAKYGLAPDYPMTASSYSEQRSALAKTLGLGQQRRGAPANMNAPEDQPVKAKGRRAKSAA